VQPRGERPFRGRATGVTLIPPIALPYSFVEMVRASRTFSNRSFAEKLEANRGGGSASLFCSGRAALAKYLLQRKKSEKSEVIIPAYTCWSVPAAVVRAGMKVRLVDVDPLDFQPVTDELGEVDCEMVSTIILPHLLVLCDALEHVVTRIREINPEIAVVEDAAQVWPPSLGTTTDATLLSFGRGKPIPLGGGGAMITADKTETGKRLDFREGVGMADWIKTALTCFSTKPSVYGIPASLPFLGIGKTIYEPDFRIAHGMFSWQRKLGSSVMERLQDWSLKRMVHAHQVIETVRSLPGWSVPGSLGEQGPIRLPVMAPDRSTRDRFVRECRRRSIVTAPMYPSTVQDIPQLRSAIVNPGEWPGAEEVANRLVTVPVYPTLSDKDVEKITTTVTAAAVEATGR